jgi:deoxyadenosine/deoxycytidine kinase
MKMHPSIITIEGNIGSGKTSLAKRLATDIDATLVLETFADNPFLQKFFVRQQEYALGMEMFFMAERYEQLKNEFANYELINQHIIIDYLFTKSLLYAKVNLAEAEYYLFQKIFNILNPKLPHSDTIIYLHAGIDRLIENIYRRGREFELTVKREYLQKIENVYFEHFRQHPEQVILVLDVNEADFIFNEEHYKKIKLLSETQHPAGISNFKIF